MVSQVEQELLTLPVHLSSSPGFSGARITRSLTFCVCFVDRCLSFFFWPLCCLFFFDLRILITPLVSSNSSYFDVIIYAVMKSNTKKYHTAGTIQNSNIKIVERDKINTLTRKYMTVHFPGLVQAL